MDSQLQSLSYFLQSVRQGLQDPRSQQDFARLDRIYHELLDLLPEYRAQLLQYFRNSDPNSQVLPNLESEFLTTAINIIEQKQAESQQGASIPPNLSELVEQQRQAQVQRTRTRTQVEQAVRAFENQLQQPLDSTRRQEIAARAAASIDDLPQQDATQIASTITSTIQASGAFNLDELNARGQRYTGELISHLASEIQTAGTNVQNQYQAPTPVAQLPDNVTAYQPDSTTPYGPLTRTETLNQIQQELNSLQAAEQATPTYQQLETTRRQYEEVSTQLQQAQPSQASTPEVTNPWAERLKFGIAENYSPRGYILGTTDNTERNSDLQSALLISRTINQLDLQPRDFSERNEYSRVATIPLASLPQAEFNTIQAQNPQITRDDVLIVQSYASRRSDQSGRNGSFRSFAVMSRDDADNFITTVQQDPTQFTQLLHATNGGQPTTRWDGQPLDIRPGPTVTIVPNTTVGGTIASEIRPETTYPENYNANATPQIESQTRQQRYQELQETQTQLSQQLQSAQSTHEAAPEVQELRSRSEELRTEQQRIRDIPLSAYATTTPPSPQPVSSNDDLPRSTVPIIPAAAQDAYNQTISNQSAQLAQSVVAGVQGSVALEQLAAQELQTNLQNRFDALLRNGVPESRAVGMITNELEILGISSSQARNLARAQSENYRSSLAATQTSYIITGESATPGSITTATNQVRARALAEEVLNEIETQQKQPIPASRRDQLTDALTTELQTQLNSNSDPLDLRIATTSTLIANQISPDLANNVTTARSQSFDTATSFRDSTLAASQAFQQVAIGAQDATTAIDQLRAQAATNPVLRDHLPYYEQALQEVVPTATVPSPASAAIPTEPRGRLGISDTTIATVAAVTATLPSDKRESVTSSLIGELEDIATQERRGLIDSAQASTNRQRAIIQTLRANEIEVTANTLNIANLASNTSNTSSNSAIAAVASVVGTAVPSGSQRLAVINEVNDRLIDIHNQELRGLLSTEEATTQRQQVISRSLSTVGITASPELLDQATGAYTTASSFQSGPRQRETAARLATEVISTLSPTSDVSATQINTLQNQLETAFQINLTAQATPAQLQQVAANIVGRQNISTTTGATPDLSTVDFQAATTEAAAARYANNILARVAAGELNAEGARTLLRQEARANPTLAANLTVIENDLQTVYADRTDSLRDTRAQDRYIEREVEKRLRAEGLLGDNQDYQTSKSSIERYQEIAEAKTTDGISKILEASGRKFNSEAERVQTILEIKDSLMQEAYATRDNTDLQGTLTRAITAQLQKQSGSSALAYKSGITPETASAAEALATQLATDSSFKMALNLHSQIDQAKAASLEAEYVKGGPATRQRQALVAATQAVAVGANITENQRVTLQRNLESDLASINRQIADGSITATEGQSQISRAVVRNLQAVGLDAQRAEDLGSQAANFANRIATQTQNQQLTPTLSQIKDISAALSSASTVANSAKVTTDRDAFLTQVNSSLQQIQEDYSQGRISAQTAQRQISRTLQTQLQAAGLEQDEAKKLVQKAQRHAETATAPALTKELNPTLATQVGLLVQTGLAVGANTQDYSDIGLKTAKAVGVKVPKQNEATLQDIQNIAKITAISNNVSDYIATEKGLSDDQKSKLQGDLRRTITELIKSGADAQSINQAVQDLLADKYGTAIQGIPPSRFGIADAEHADPASKFTGEAYAQHIKASQTEKDLLVMLEQVMPSLNENDRKLLAQELTGAVFGEIIVTTDTNGKDRILIGHGIFNSKAFDLTIAEREQLGKLRPQRADFANDADYLIKLSEYNSQLDAIFESKKSGYLDTLSAGFADYLREAASKKGLKLGKNIRIGDLYEAGYLAALLSPEVIGETNAEYRELHGKNFDPNEVVSLEEAVKRLLRERVQNLDSYINNLVEIQKRSIQNPYASAADLAQASNFLSNGIDFITDIASTRYAENRIQALARLPIDKLYDTSMRLAGINKEYAASYYLHATINGSFGTARNILLSDIAKFEDRYGRYLKFSVSDLITGDGPLPDNIPAYLRAQIRGLRKRHQAMEAYQKSMPQWAQKILEDRAVRRKKLSNKIGQEFMDQVIMRGDVGGFLINSLGKRGALYFTNKVLEGTGYFRYDKPSKAMIFIPLEQAREDARQKFYELRDRTITFVWNTRPVKAIREFSANVLKRSAQLIEAGATKVIGKTGVEVAKKAGALLTKLVAGLIPTGITQIIAAYSGIKALIGAIPILGWIIMPIWNRLERLVLTVVKVLFALLMWIIWQTLGWVFSSALGVIGAVGSVINFFQNWGTTIGNGWGVLTSGIGGFFSGLGAGISGALSGAGAAVASTAGAIASAGSVLAGLTASVPSAFLGFLSTLGPLGVPALGVLTIGPYVAMLNIAALTEAFNNAPDNIAGPADELDTVNNPLSIIKSADSTDKTAGETIRYTITVNAPACDSPLLVEDTLPTNTTFNGVIGYEPFSAPVSSIETSGPDPDSTLRWRITIDNPEGPCSNFSGTSSSLTDTSATLDQIRSLLAQRSSSPLNNPAYGDSAQAIYDAAREFGINPIAMIGIFWTENGLGSLGISRPTGADGGCYNLGGINRCPTVGASIIGTQSCVVPSDPDNFWCKFTNYEDAIRANFAVVRRLVYDQGHNTVEKLANRYIPIEDPRFNGQYNNCPRVSPRVEADDPTSPFPGDTGSCIVPTGYNTLWKWRVAGVMQNRSFTQLDLAQYRAFRLAEEAGTTTTLVEVRLFFEAVVNTDITNDAGEPNKGCVNNTATATIGTAPSQLANRDNEIVSVGGETCISSEVPPMPSNVVDVLCSDEYKICPTNMTTGDRATVTPWNNTELEALWAVAYRIKQSNRYWTLSVGNYTVEVQKNRCISGDTYCINQRACTPVGDTCIWWYGQYEGLSGPRTIPNSRLIIIADKASERTRNDQRLGEWLFAHELAHSASWGTDAGGLGGRNSYFEAVNTARSSCGEGPVSNYGAGSLSENNAEVVSFFMTKTEDLRALNGTPSRLPGSLETQFPCQYNATETGYFNGISF